MSIFQFSKCQRVTVPEAMAGAKGVQGVVAEGHAELGAEPRYILQWPNADKLGDNGIFVMVAGEVGQGALAQAQPPLMVTADESTARAMKAYENGRNDLRMEIQENERVAREIRAAKRKKPAKAKSKSKRKR